MYIEQIYTNCLAQGAYYIESNGEAAVIDPMRDVDYYIRLAESRHAKIRYVFETHFHADFVSGHIDLSKKTQAPIVFGPTGMETGYAIINGKDGQEFMVGKMKVTLIHTPGHTMESCCYLLTDEFGKESALFTGDTLFIGDVGRPDLAQKVIAELTREKLAGHLYDSLRNKIMPLNDDLIVYPGHGAGSACGKKMSNETQDTLGHQKKTNYALNPTLSKEEFMEEVLNGLTAPPGYFPQNVLANIKGYESIDAVIARGAMVLNADAFQLMSDSENAIIIDTRDAQDFAKSFVPGSINIGLNGSFAVWLGTVVPDINQKILLVAAPGREEEAVRRMSRVGFDKCIGYLEGGFDAWMKAGKKCDSITSITADDFLQRYEGGQGRILDVRKESEYRSEHIVGAHNLPLDYYRDHIAEVQSDVVQFVHCAAGYRSMIFISLLKKLGYNNLIDIKGGFGALKATHQLPITDFAEQQTEL